MFVSERLAAKHRSIVMADDKRRALLQFGVGSVGLAALPVWAQADWPSKAIVVIVPFPAGGGTDAFARPISAVMSKSLGNAIDPRDLAETYGLDALRYFLLREGSLAGDGDFGGDMVGSLPALITGGAPPAGVKRSALSSRLRTSRRMRVRSNCMTGTSRARSSATGLFGSAAWATS